MDSLGRFAGIVLTVLIIILAIPLGLELANAGVDRIVQWIAPPQPPVPFEVRMAQNDLEAAQTRFQVAQINSQATQVAIRTQQTQPVYYVPAGSPPPAAPAAAPAAAAPAPGVTNGTPCAPTCNGPAIVQNARTGTIYLVKTGASMATEGGSGWLFASDSEAEDRYWGRGAWAGKSHRQEFLSMYPGTRAAP